MELDIKSIFERKKVEFIPSDIARMRFLCRIFVENVIDFQREFKEGFLNGHETFRQKRENDEMEIGSSWLKTSRDR